MKIKILSVAALAAVILTLCAGCAPKGTNILEQSEDYVGEFYVPSSKKVESGSALSVITAINENGYKVKSSVKTQSDDKSLIESYKLDCYGVSIELFKYAVDSEKFAEIVSAGKYVIKDSSGKVLREFDTEINGHFVLIFSSKKDYDGNDRTEDNAKIAEIFNSLDLQ